MSRLLTTLVIIDHLVYAANFYGPRLGRTLLENIAVSVGVWLILAGLFGCTVPHLFAIIVIFFEARFMIERVLHAIKKDDSQSAD